jgi:hypothetical protein
MTLVWFGFNKPWFWFAGFLVSNQTKDITNQFCRPMGHKPATLADDPLAGAAWRLARTRARSSVTAQDTAELTPCVLVWISLCCDRCQCDVRVH